MAATTSRVGAQIDGLYTALLALSGTVTVVDGPPLSWDPVVVPAPGAVNEAAYLFVGAHPDDDTSTQAAQDRSTLGTGRGEDIHTYCTVYVSSGDDQPLKTLRDQALGLVGAAEQAIRADLTLGGAVATSRVSNVDRIDQRRTEDGADVIVVFTVTGKAYLR